MAASNDYYQILGVTKSATADEVKRAYRRLALQYHPDRNKTKEALEKFKEVTKAYEVLGDAQKRQTYDQFGAAAFAQGSGGQPGGGPFGGGGGQQGGPFGGAQGGQYGPFTYTYSTGGNQGDFGGFADPFEIFEQFFGGGGSPFGTRQRRAVYSITISFDDAVHGAEKQVSIDGKTQKVKIPAGVDSGSRIRFGEYDVVVDVMPSSKFQREGSDIVSEQELSFSEASLGTEINIETIHGPVKLRIPSGTQPETLFRLRGKGVPRIKSSSNGDHYVRIKIHVPKTLTKRQRELLQEFEDEGKQRKSWF